MPKSTRKPVHGYHPVGDPALSRQIKNRADQLPPLARKVLTLYFFDGLRLSEIAQHCGEKETRIAPILAQCIGVVHQVMRSYPG